MQEITIDKTSDTVQTMLLEKDTILSLIHI